MLVWWYRSWEKGLSILSTDCIKIPRLCLFLGGVTYVGYLASNLYVKPWTLLPAAGLLGMGASVLWTAQGVQ